VVAYSILHSALKNRFERHKEITAFMFSFKINSLICRQ